MPGQDGTEPVGNDELLYRRIPVSTGWCDLHGVSPEAFHPQQYDLSGISLYRAKYKSLLEAASGKSSKGCFVAVLRAGDLTNRGVPLLPRPGKDDPGHVELPSLRFDNRRTREASEQKVLLANLCLKVEGPFPSVTA